MDIISPIIIKKINLIDEKAIKAPYSADYINENLNKKSRAFFDNISNFFIKVYNEELIQIFNKQGNVLKKSLNIKLNVEKVNCCAIEKHLNHLLVQFDNKMILIINVKNEKVCDILHFDFTNLIGMTFIKSTGASNVNQFNTANNFINSESVFFLLFPNKINFFKISGIPNENVRDLKMIKHTNIITNALFNIRYEILLLEKGEKNYEFYNLSNEKFFNKPHPFSLISKKNRDSSGFSRLLGIFLPSQSESNNARLSINKSSN